MQRISITAAILVLSFFLSAELCHAQSRSGIPGPKGKTHTAIPTVITDSLPNGLRYYLTRVNSIPLTEISIVMDAGLTRELQGETGLAFATTQLLLAGSEKRTRQMIEDFLHEQAAVVLPYTHYDYAQLYAKTLNKNFSATMDVLADVIINPTFPEQHLATLKLQATTQLPDQRAAAGERASRELINILCGDGNVLSRRLQPNESELKSVSREMLTAFHERCYVPERTTVVVTGDLDPTFVRTVLTERFGNWKRSVEPLPESVSIAATKSGNLIIDDSSTVHNLAYFRLGMKAIAPTDSRFPALVVLNGILGEGADSRLRSALWGRHMVAPSFTSNIGVSMSCSYLIISGWSSPILADSVVLLVKGELEALATTGITAKELEDTKASLLRDNALMFSSNRSLQSLLKEAAAYGGTIDEAFSFPERLKALTVADVNALAKDLFTPSGLSVVVLGNAITLRRPLTSVLGSVPVMRAGTR